LFVRRQRLARMPRLLSAADGDRGDHHQNKRK
jgi:hypothetical protein